MPKNPRRNNKSRFKEPKEFEEVVLQIARVTRVVKGGRRLRFRATVAIGNKKGKVGLGIGKATEVSTAIQKAVQRAKKELIEVPIVRETIPHEVKLRYKSAEVLLMPAPLGKGIIAGGATRVILELAGYKNVLGKRFGTTSLLVNAQATIEALRSLELVPGQEVDKISDKKEDQGQKKKKKKAILPPHVLGRKSEEEKKADKKEEPKKEEGSNDNKEEKPAEEPEKKEEEKKEETKEQEVKEEEKAEEKKEDDDKKEEPKEEVKEEKKEEESK